MVTNNGSSTRPQPNRVVAPDEMFDAEVDVVVVGSGAAAFSAALHAAWADQTVLMLEKGTRVGGTTFKSHGWTWWPNNSYLRAAGVRDEKIDALRYMAKLARPHHYQPDHPTLGLEPWEYQWLETYYDRGPDVLDSLVEHGALRVMHGAEVPDYFANLPEDKTPRGRVMMVSTDTGELGYGDEMVNQLDAARATAGIDLHLEHEVVQVLLNDERAVVGVTAQSPEGLRQFRARKAVVFGTGGFGRNQEYLDNFLAHPIHGSCAAITNTGDFIPIATSLGAQLRNMNYAWFAPTTFEKWVNGKDDPDYASLFAPPGDSMIFVNRKGRRVLNEHAVYNELAQGFFGWDGARSEFSNLFQLMIWDEDCQRIFNGYPNRNDNPIPPAGEDDSHVIHGQTWAELVENIRERLASLAERTGGYTLDDRFEENLAQTIDRFNELARRGKDEDFGRGENPIELILQTHNTPALRESDLPSKQLHPISDTGPYHAVIATAGTLDTKGGPLTNASAQVLDATGAPIPGLYGAGNCVASGSGKGYFAAGATLAPAFTFGAIAGRHAAAEPVKELRAPVTV